MPKSIFKKPEPNPLQIDRVQPVSEYQFTPPDTRFDPVPEPDPTILDVLVDIAESVKELRVPQDEGMFRQHVITLPTGSGESTLTVARSITNLFIPPVPRKCRIYVGASRGFFLAELEQFQGASIELPKATRQIFIDWDAGVSSTDQISIFFMSEALKVELFGVEGAGGGGGAVTIVDGGAATIGSLADTAWVAGNGSVISLLKNLAGSLATLAGSVVTSRMNTNILRTGFTNTITIANGATDSSAIDISNTIAGGFMIPSAFTGSSISYKVSYNNAGHQPLYDQYGNQVTTPIAVNRCYPFPQEAAGFSSIILVSNLTETGLRSINTFKKG